MKMALASNVDNIRYNGTGRAYVADVGSLHPGLDLGELENLSFNIKVSTEKLKSTRNAARATILEVETEREASLSFGLREQSEDNMKMALLGSAINTLNQAASGASGIYQTTKTWVADSFLDLGYMNVFITKVSGTITGTLAVGDTVTGDVSTKAGKVAFVGSGYIILVQCTGAFTGDTKLSKDVANYITLSGVEVLEDVCITSSNGATLRANGTDYSVDPDYGYVRKLSGGGLLDADKVSFDYAAVDRKYIWGLSAGSVTKKFTFVSDKDDQGPRQRWTFHKVQINLSGDINLIAEKNAVLSITGSVLADTTQPSGQEYYKVEMMA
jgi:hypothetical protein